MPSDDEKRAKRTGRKRRGGWWQSRGRGRFLVGVRKLKAWLEELDLEAPYVVWSVA